MKLTVASYNIRHGADAGLDMTKIASCIKKAGADIVGIQEMDVNTTRVGGRDTFAELLAATGFEYGDFVKCIDYKGGGYGTAILSKYPIASFDKKFLHFEKGCEQRAVGVCRVKAEEKEFAFANTHLDLLSDTVRRTQLKEIRAILPDGLPYFLTGDFNTQNFSLFSEFENGVALLDETNKIVTYPGTGKTIDNIVYRSDIKPLDFGTVTESYSDHNLLWGIFEF